MNLENYTQEKLTIDLVKANFEALKYFLFFGIIFFLPYYLIWGFETKKVLETDGVLLKAFYPFFALFFGIIIHELIHGIFFATYASQGFKSIKFGVLWKMLTPYCHCKEPLKIKHYTVALLAPLIILGIIPAIAGIIIGSVGLTIFGIFFSGAAAGDIMIYNLIKKENPEDLVQDHPSEAGCYIFRKK